MDKKFLLLVFVSVVAVSASNKTKRSNFVKHHVRRFPDGFQFGTATASYQIEGGWDADGKGESIWDHLTHVNPCAIKDCSNGDIADDSYHQYKRDVEMMRELGLNYYRFSISWPRILPNSFPNNISEVGVQYYNNLINEMLKYNIEPMITLYHWDLPQKLQDMGGWTNPKIVDWFGDYARVAFELFGDRVKTWITINEPYQVCTKAYNGVMAPMVNIGGVADYMCNKNLLLAHARAYHIYDQDFRIPDAKIFMAIDAQWYMPYSMDDIVAADEANQFLWKQFAHPIFSETGGFPPAMVERVAAKSAEQGFRQSRLPEFTPEERDYVKGTADVFGLNHYLTFMVYRNGSVTDGRYPVPSFMDDAGVILYQKDEWTLGDSNFIVYFPRGFYNLLSEIRKEYNNPPIIITENGFATASGGLEDEDRVTYYRGFINAMLDAMEDGSDIRAYTAWSLLDNFEWKDGYTVRFGLYEVDYESPNRTRTPRKSAFVYKEIIRTHSLDVEYEPPADAVMTIEERRCSVSSNLYTGTSHCVAPGSFELVD